MPARRGKLQRDGLPDFDAVVVGLLRKFRDREPAMLIDHGRLRPRAAERRTRREDHLQILIGLLVAQNPFGDLEQTAELDLARHAGCRGRLEFLFARPAKAQRAEAR